MTVATTLSADFGDSRGFGAVTMGTGIITFTGSLAATSFSDTGKLVLGTNATVTVNGDFVFSGSTEQYLAYTICSGAVLRVTGDIVNNGTKGSSPCPIRMGTGTFTIAAKGLVAAGSSIATMPQTGGLAVFWEIGEDGISGANLISHPNISLSARFTAESDFTIAAPMALGKVFTFDTGDGYTVTLGDGDGNGWFVRGGRMEISGAGKVVCNCVSTNVYNTYDAYSGEVRVLSGAALTFNFTDAAAAPVLAVAGGKSAKASGAVTVGISGDASAKKVPYALTTCGGFGSATVTLAAGSPDWAKLSVDGNGNLVLERKKTGLVLIVR